VHFVAAAFRNVCVELRLLHGHGGLVALLYGFLVFFLKDADQSAFCFDIDGGGGVLLGAGSRGS
jgi:hypothetical protein